MDHEEANRIRWTLDTGLDARALQVGAPAVCFSGKPFVLWCSGARNQPACLWAARPASGQRWCLDRGELGEPCLAPGRQGRALALWSRLAGRGPFEIVCAELHAPASTGDPRPPVRVLAAGALSAPVAACGQDGAYLVAWSAVRGSRRVIEGRRGADLADELAVDWGPALGWRSRPFVCSLERGGFAVLWDELSARGGCLKGVLLEPSGEVSRRFEVFRAQAPGVRYLFASACAASDRILIAALRTVDVTGDHGIVDQHHEIAAAAVSALTGEIEELHSLADLDHGLLCDPAVPTEVWGYLGFRRRPRLLADGTLCYERKEAHDGHTTRAAGVLCCRLFDPANGGWQPEIVVHRGGMSYAFARETDGHLHVAYRTVRQADDALPCLDEASHSLVWEQLSPPERLQTEQTAWLRPPGWKRMHFTARNPGAERPTAKFNAGTMSLYWGDPHVHSALSLDAEGEPDELLHYARDLAGLDFVALTENDEMYNCWSTPWERRMGEMLAEAWDQPDRFAVVSGFEYTCPLFVAQARNHRTVLLAGRRGLLFRWTDLLRPGMSAEQIDEATLSCLRRRSEEARAVLIAHHATRLSTGSEREAGIEAASGWDTYIHDPRLVHEAWSREHVPLALIGGSDAHRRNPGLAGALTGVWTDRLTPEGVLEGIRARRTIATQGRRPTMLLMISDQRGGSLFLGERGKLEGSLSAQVMVQTEAGSADRIVLVELKAGERVLANWSTQETEGGTLLQAQTALPVNAERAGFAYLRVRLDGPDSRFPSNISTARGPWAWSSPIWWTPSENGEIAR